jgi:hypothetical protein
MPLKSARSNSVTGVPTSTLQPSYLGASDRRTVPVFDRVTPPPASNLVWKADPKAGMQEMLEPAMLIGLGAVVVWTHVNHPGLRPGSLLRAIVHVALSFVGFALLPMALSVLLPLLSSRTSQPYVVLALLIPALTYLLLSWIWLIARVLDDISGNPRAGHPVSTKS